MKQKLYSLGEIHRLGLLKNKWGEPYKHKANVSQALKGTQKVEVKTAHGIGYAIPLATIQKLNKRFKTSPR